MRLGRLCSISWWLSSLISAFEGFSPHSQTSLFSRPFSTLQISTFHVANFGLCFFLGLYHADLHFSQPPYLCFPPKIFAFHRSSLESSCLAISEGMNFLSPMYKLEAGKKRTHVQGSNEPAVAPPNFTAKNMTHCTSAQPFCNEGPNLHSDFR